MQTLFVYYKLPIAEHAQWRPRVEAFQVELKQKWSGLSAVLMQRPEATPDGIETWMEIYSHKEGVTQEMMDSIAAEAIAHSLPPKRMSEFLFHCVNLFLTCLFEEHKDDRTKATGTFT